MKTKLIRFAYALLRSHDQPKWVLTTLGLHKAAYISQVKEIMQQLWCVQTYSPWTKVFYQNTQYLEVCLHGHFPLSFSAPASPEVCYHHKACIQLPSVHPLWPTKQLVLLSTMTHSHLCSIKISITHNGKRFTAPKH